MTMLTVALGGVAEVNMGQAPKGDTYNEDGVGLPLIAGAGDFSGDVPLPKKFTTATGVRKSQPGDIVLGIRASIGDRVWADGEYCLGRGVAGLRAGPRLDQQYLWHWLGHAKPALAAKGKGATFLQVNRRDVAEMEVPLPPLDEQRRIAGILDAADALRAKRRQALAKLDTLTQSIFIDMFGDPVANHRGWPEAPLADLCDKVQIGPFGSLLHQSDYIEDGIPLVNPMHIVDGTIAPRHDQTLSHEKASQLGTYRLREGDVVMGRRGEMGRCAVVDKETDGYICGSGSLFLRPDTAQVQAEFLRIAISTDVATRRWEQVAQGQTMPNLNSDIVETFAIGRPPIELQTQFVEASRAAHESRTRVVTHSARLDVLFASLQQRAFRGDL